jgi:hypothetical protein
MRQKLFERFYVLQNIFNDDAHDVENNSDIKTKMNLYFFKKTKVRFEN